MTTCAHFALSSLDKVRKALLERIENPEGHLLFSPEIGCVTKHVKQCFTRLAVKFLGVRKLLQNNKKPELTTRFVHEARQAIRQGVEVLPKMPRELKSLGNRCQDLLFGGCIAAIGIQKMLAQLGRFRLKLSDTESTD